MERDVASAIGPTDVHVVNHHGSIEAASVEPGGARYWVLVLDDTTESYRVTSVHGPYAAE